MQALRFLTILSVLSYWIPAIAPAQGYNCEEELFPRKDKATRLYGYVNALSEYRVPPTFLKARPFVGKTAIVQQGKLFGVINCDGILIIPAEYEDISAFCDGRGWVKKGGLYGLISEQGRMLIQPMYEDVKEINVFSGTATWVKKAGQWGLISRENGRMLLNPRYDEISVISDSASIGRSAAFQDLVYTGDGRIIIPGIRSISRPSPGLFIYESDKRKFGTFNSLAYIHLRPEFESIRMNGNLLQTKKDGKAGLRNFRGMIVAEEKYDTIYPFAGEFLVAAKGDSGFILNSRGGRNLPPGKYRINLLNAGFALIQQNEKTGFWAPNRKKWISPLQAMKTEVASGRDWVKVVNAGSRAVYIQDASDLPMFRTGWDSLVISDPADAIRAQKEQKFFLVNARNPSAGAGYDEIIPLGKGFFSCRNGANTGLISASGRQLLAFEFSYIRKMTTSSGACFIAAKNGKEYLYSESGKLLHQGTFSKILPASSRLFPASDEGKWGVARADGSWLIENRFDSVQILFRMADEIRFPLVMYRKGKAILLDESGNELADACECRWMDGGEGKLFLKKNGTFSLYDAKGKIQGNLVLEDFQFFSEGNAAVKTNGSWGFINTTGRMVIPARFAEVLPFRNGIAYARENDLWGVLRKNGSWLVKPSGTGVATDADGKRHLLLP